MVNLSRMRVLISCERRLQIKHRKAFDDATKVTTVLTGMPRGSGNHSQTENGAIELAEVEEAYRDVFEELTSMREELKQLLRYLDNPDDKGVMELRYIDGHDVKDIPKAARLSERAMFYHLAGGERKLMQMFPDKVIK